MQHLKRYLYALVACFFCLCFALPASARVYNREIVPCAKGIMLKRGIDDVGARKLHVGWPDGANIITRRTPTISQYCRVEIAKLEAAHVAPQTAIDRVIAGVPSLAENSPHPAASPAPVVHAAPAAPAEAKPTPTKPTAAAIPNRTADHQTVRTHTLNATQNAFVLAAITWVFRILAILAFAAAVAIIVWAIATFIAARLKRARKPRTQPVDNSATHELIRNLTRPTHVPFEQAWQFDDHKPSEELEAQDEPVLELAMAGDEIAFDQEEFLRARTARTLAENLARKREEGEEAGVGAIPPPGGYALNRLMNRRMPKK